MKILRMTQIKKVTQTLLHQKNPENYTKQGQCMIISDFEV